MQHIDAILSFLTSHICFDCKNLLYTTMYFRHMPLCSEHQKKKHSHKIMYSLYFKVIVLLNFYKKTIARLKSVYILSGSVQNYLDRQQLMTLKLSFYYLKIINFAKNTNLSHSFICMRIQTHMYFTKTARPSRLKWIMTMIVYGFSVIIIFFVYLYANMCI